MRRSAIRIRTALPEDAIEVCKVVRMSIEKLCVEDHQGDKAILDRWLANKTPETVARWFANPDNINLVAVDDGDAILAAGCVRRDGTVLLNYVSPDARFRGVSSALLTALEDAARSEGNDWCVLESTRTAHRFYRERGSKLPGIHSAVIPFRLINLAVVLIAGLCQAQTPVPLHFEVASVRPAGLRPPYTPIPGAGDIKGGPGTSDPTRMTFTWTPIRVLLMKAFALPLDQISGSDWVMGQDARFDISAILPEGATKEQVNEMLLNLLKERFHLTYHTAKKDFDLYSLVIAKGKLKLKGSAPALGPLPEAPQPAIARAEPLDRDGFPHLPTGRPGFQGRTANGVTRLTFRMQTLEQLSSYLQFVMKDSRVVDKTGLKGLYDFNLEFSRAGLGLAGRSLSPSGEAEQLADAPDLFNALEKQLGLKLEKSKMPVDVIVIDHMEKQPTEN